MPKFPYITTKSKRLEKLTRNEQADLTFDLINAFSLVKNPLSTSLLLQDLLTALEIKNLSKRLRIAKFLLAGKKQDKIIEELHCSFGTIAKVKSWLEEAGEGLKDVVKKLPKRREKFKLIRDYYGYGLPQILIGTYLNHLEERERKRVEDLLQNAEKKKKVFAVIQELVNEQFKRKKI